MDLSLIDNENIDILHVARIQVSTSNCRAHSLHPGSEKSRDIEGSQLFTLALRQRLSAVLYVCHHSYSSSLVPDRILGYTDPSPSASLQQVDNGEAGCRALSRGGAAL